MSSAKQLLHQLRESYPGNPAREGAAAAKRDDAVATARKAGDIETLKKIRQNIGTAEFTRCYGALTEGVQDTERETFRKRNKARVDAGLRELRTLLTAVEKEAARYHEDLTRTWTYSGDATRLAETIEACIERLEWVKE